MIEQSTIDRVLSAAKIEEVVGDFISLRRSGSGLVGLCPFHADKNPSFHVSPAKNICRCFACGKGGAPVGFIMEHEHLSYPDALRYLARKYHIDIVETSVSPEMQAYRNERESLFAVNQFAQEYFTNTLWNTEDGRSIGLSYFRERGMSDEIIRKFGLGYSLDTFDGLLQAALRAGYEQKYLLKVGLCSQNEKGNLRDRFWGRVMFPVHTLSGKVLAFGGRILKKSEHAAKYINSPESDIYHKSNELYGIYFAKNAMVREDTCFLVEGYTDVISMHQAGIENVVASSGTALTSGQIRMIHRFTSNITVLYDGDAAGIHASLRGIDMLLAEGMNVKVLLLPNGEDPDSFARGRDAVAFRTYIAEHQTDFIRFKTDLLLQEAADDPVKRAGLISDIVASIAVIPDAITRSSYTKECAERFAMREELLVHEVEKRRVVKQPMVQNPPPSSLQVVEQHTPFYAQERALLQFVLRHGNEPIEVEVEEGQVQSLPLKTYIRLSLESDDMPFQSPLHLQVQAEAEQVVGDLSLHFYNHPDDALREYVFQLLEEKHEKSRLWTKDSKPAQELDNDQSRLLQQLQQLLLEYKYQHLLAQRAAYTQRYKNALKSNQEEEAECVVQSKMQVDEQIKAVAKILGRVMGG